MLSWGQYNNPKLLWNQLTRLTAGAQEPVSVRRIETAPDHVGTSFLARTMICVANDDDDAGGDVHVVGDDEVNYATDADVLSFYKEISWENAVEERPSESAAVVQRKNGVVRAYFNEKVLNVSAAEKGVRADHEYNIRFHANAFKRVVLWHLSQFHEVVFY